MVMRLLRVISSTADCVPMHPLVLRPANLSAVVVHRISLSQPAPGNLPPIPDDELTGPMLVERFTENHELGTGRRAPYHVLIRTDGAAEQMLPLVCRGTHVPNYNWCTWAVAVVGRTHEREMPDKQWLALREALAVLNVYPRQIRSHSELDPSKHPPCPGKYVNMDQLRLEVQDRMPKGCEDWDNAARLRYIARAGFCI